MVCSPFQEPPTSCRSPQGRFDPKWILEWFVAPSTKLMQESSGDFGPHPAPAWVPWMLLKMSFLLSLLETRPWQSHGKGFSSPAQRSWSRFPRDAEAQQHLQGWRRVLLSTCFWKVPWMSGAALGDNTLRKGSTGSNYSAIVELKGGTKWLFISTMKSGPVAPPWLG